MPSGLNSLCKSKNKCQNINAKNFPTDFDSGGNGLIYKTMLI